MNKQNIGYQLESKTLYEQQKNIRSNPNYFLARAIIAENLQTPENLGSILRLADAAGSKEVCFLTENKLQKLSKLKKTARNCEFLVHWHTTTTTNFLNNNIASYPNLIAIELTTKSKNLFQVSLPRDSTFVVGNERFGISSDLLKKCNDAIHVPMYGVNGSMNVTHALAIVLFEWRRQHAVSLLT